MSPFTKSFFIAQTFLTRIPTPKLTKINEEDVSLSLLYYPLIGFFLGLILILSASFLSSIVDPSAYNVIAVIIVALWVLITGALHLDGLADSTDGFIGGQGNTERTLQIMKDPVSGPAGITSIILILMLKYTAIVAILNSEMSYWSLLLTPVIARAIAIGLITFTPVAQQQGLAFELKKKEHPEIVALILLLVALITFFITNLYVLILISLLVYAIRHGAIKRLQGITGDILGLSIEVTEAVVLVLAVLVAVSI
jgi:adenosylcobinamide-GDP ribazoletransferase